MDNTDECGLMDTVEHEPVILDSSNTEVKLPVQPVQTNTTSEERVSPLPVGEQSIIPIPSGEQSIISPMLNV